MVKGCFDTVCDLRLLRSFLRLSITFSAEQLCIKFISARFQIFVYNPEQSESPTKVYLRIISRPFDKNVNKESVQLKSVQKQLNKTEDLNLSPLKLFGRSTASCVIMMH